MAKIDQERIGQWLWNALQILKDNGGELPGREVVRQLSSKLKFNDYEQAVLEKTGNIRWHSILHFYTIDLIKAGWLLKKKGIWYLTPEGIDALQMKPLEFMNEA